MCLDKSTFNFIRSTCTTIRRPWGSNRYDSRDTVITVKRPDSVMVWRSFSGTLGCAGLYFLPKNTTMNSPLGTRTGRLYADVHGYPRLHPLLAGRCALRRLQMLQGIFGWAALPGDWLAGNSLDGSPIENCWNQMKNLLKKRISLCPQAHRCNQTAVDWGAQARVVEDFERFHAQETGDGDCRQGRHDQVLINYVFCPVKRKKTHCSIFLTLFHFFGWRVSRRYAIFQIHVLAKI